MVTKCKCGAYYSIHAHSFNRDKCLSCWVKEHPNLKFCPTPKRPYIRRFDEYAGHSYAAIACGNCREQVRQEDVEDGVCPNCGYQWIDIIAEAEVLDNGKEHRSTGHV